MDSALMMSQSSAQKLRVIWINNANLGCAFDKLFKPIPSIDLVEPKIASLYVEPSEIIVSNKLKKGLLTHLSKLYKRAYFDRVIYPADMASIVRSSAENNRLAAIGTFHRGLIITDQPFYKSNSYQNFQPIDSLAQEIAARTAEFNNHTIGIHIRRGDNQASIRNSPTSIFFEAISNEISRRPEAKFYVASDDLSVKQNLCEQFGKRIITSLEKTSRNTESGIQAAVVDLYALSKTQKIYGSYWSSYSIAAATLAGAELVILRA
ncbi:MAG: hypothetical protein AAF152_04290 [Cyanobacteria bacterium P01_A01_bin.114]